MSDVQKQFGNVAANYATSAVHAGGNDLNTMLAAVNFTGDELVLDAGCGAGHTGLAFAPHVEHVVAYDLTPQMLAQVERLAAERGIQNLSIEQGNVESLPFEDDLFDIVVSRYSAHHWRNPQAALVEFLRVLKPGGMLILGDIVGFEDAMQDTFLQTIELLRDPSHVRDHTVTQWLDMIEMAEFQFSEVLLNFDLPLGFQSWLTRMATPERNAALIHALWEGAPEDVQHAFHLPNPLPDDFDFVINGAVIRAFKV